MNMIHRTSSYHAKHKTILNNLSGSCPSPRAPHGPSPRRKRLNVKNAIIWIEVVTSLSLSITHHAIARSAEASKVNPEDLPPTISAD